MNSRGKLFPKALLWLLVFAMACTIYIFSGQEGAVSHRLSREVVKEAGTLIELPGTLKHLTRELDLSYELVSRKMAHFSLFFALAVLLYFAIRPLATKHPKILTVICCLFFAGMDEYHQIFIAGRTARLTDIIIDTAGALCGLLVVTAFTGIWRKVRENIQEH